MFYGKIFLRKIFLAPVCLPDKNEDFLGKFGWAAGWGALNPGSRLRPKTLQAVDVPVIDNRFEYLINFVEFFFVNFYCYLGYARDGIVRMV